MAIQELSLTAAEFFQTSLEISRQSFPVKRCISSDIQCFRGEEQKLLSLDNSDNSGAYGKSASSYPYLSKQDRSLTHRIMDLSKRRQLNVALQILDDAMLDNYKPNRAVMNAALEACVHCGDISCAHALFDNMLKPGNCGVDGLTYKILIKGLGKSRMLDEAYELVEALEDGTAPGGPPLTEVHLHTLLNAFADAGEIMRAHGVLNRFRALFNNMGPSVFTYNILIKGYTRSTNPLEALKLREDMRRLGLQPQKITFNSLILACVRGGDLTEALQVLREMKEAAQEENVSDLLPDVVTYTTLIQGFGQQGSFDGVASLVKELRSSECCPFDRVAYGVVIDAFLMVECSSGLMEGLSLLEEMLELSKEKRHLRPKPHVFLSLMRAFAAVGDFQTVNRLHAEMVPLASGPVPPKNRVEADELLIEAAVNDGQPYKLKEGVCLDDPIEKWMHPIKEARPPLQSVRLSQVVMRFFRDAVVPVVDISGICVGVVHRKDCFELNASLGSLMRSPPASIRASTSVEKVITLLLESEVKTVAVLEMKEDHVLAKGSNNKLVGFLTLERVLSVKVDYPNLLMRRMRQFLTESPKNGVI